MTPNKYTSIKSVLYDIASTVPDELWDEARYMEWATKALHKLKFDSKLQQNVALIEVEQHKATVLPETVYIVQVAYKTDTDSDSLTQNMRKIMGIDDVPTELGENLRLPAAAVFATRQWRANNWLPMKVSSSSFLKAVSDIDGLDFANLKCWECRHEMSIDPDGCITTTLPNGYLLVSYLSYPVDKNGDALIPDDENLKEALMHYVYYRVYLAKSFMHEQNAIQEREYHLQRFHILGQKAVGDLNSPTLGVMENIKNDRNRLLHRAHQWESFFTKLNSAEIQIFA